MVSPDICHHLINGLNLVSYMIVTLLKNTKYVEYQEYGISSKVKSNYFKSAENYCEYRKLAHKQLPYLKDKIINLMLFDVSWIDTKLNPKYRFKI